MINTLKEAINMILFTNVFTRTNPNILFHNQVLDGTSFVRHLKTNYIDTQKLLSQWWEQSQDQLVMTYKAVWISREAFDEYTNDSVLQQYWIERDLYCDQNNITIGPRTWEDV